LRKSYGYIYVEMLAAFFICCFISLSILPIFEHVVAERHNAIERMKAYHLLYEKLQAYMEGENGAVDETFNANGRTYKLTWKPEETFYGMLRGCIEYENYGRENESICDAAKR
jgi:hypothetical protein